jgi:hypothetical protein
MQNQRAETLTRMVRAQEALEIRRQAELRAIAHSLIQTHVGGFRRGINVEKFYAALAQALLTARSRAQADCSGETVVTLS